MVEKRAKEIQEREQKLKEEQQKLKSAIEESEKKLKEEQQSAKSAKDEVTSMVRGVEGTGKTTATISLLEEEAEEYRSLSGQSARANEDMEYSSPGARAYEDDMDGSLTARCGKTQQAARDAIKRAAALAQKKQAAADENCLACKGKHWAHTCVNHTLSAPPQPLGAEGCGAAKRAKPSPVSSLRVAEVEKNVGLASAGIKRKRMASTGAVAPDGVRQKTAADYKVPDEEMEEAEVDFSQATDALNGVDESDVSSCSLASASEGLEPLATMENAGRKVNEPAAKEWATQKLEAERTIREQKEQLVAFSAQVKDAKERQEKLAQAATRLNEDLERIETPGVVSAASSGRPATIPVQVITARGTGN